MYPARFEYVRADTWEHALEQLAAYGDEARPLAGGQSLVPLMKLRLSRPQVVVDIGHLPRGSITADETTVFLPALTRHADAEQDPLLNTAFPLIRDAVGEIGDPQVRHMGTVGGALAEADPAGDWGAALLALRAEVRCRSVRGERLIPLREFFLGPYTTALAPDELVEEVRVPLPPRTPGMHTSGAYLKVERRAGGFAVAAVAVQLSVDEQGRCRSVGIGLGGLGLRPETDDEVERFMVGQPLTERLVAEAAERLARHLQPQTDNRGSAEYKRALGRVLFERAAAIARARAAGEEVEARVW